MRLENIERDFLANLISPDVDTSDFLAALHATERLDPERQLSIYKSNINGAHQKVLGQIYPACLNILGEDYFNQLCRAYRFKHPSIDADLNQYGKHFPSFLQEMSEIKSELVEFNYLANLARHEQYWHATFFVKNSRSFDFAKLSSVENEQQSELVFELAQDFSLHRTKYPVLDIWLANTSEVGVGSEQNFVLPDEDILYCIFRKHYEVRFEKVDAQQYDILFSIAKGDSLGKIAQQSNNELQTIISDFIQKGWINNFRLKE